VGWVGEHIGPRVAIGMGGVASMACGLFAYRALARIRLRANGEEPTVEVQEREG